MSAALKNQGKRLHYHEFERPPFDKNSEHYKILAAKNSLDLMLFEYVKAAYDDCIIPSILATTTSISV